MAEIEDFIYETPSLQSQMIPRASVVIPAFNAAAYIDASVAAALGQHFEDFEVIVIDDGSTDGTAERLKVWKDSRLRIITQAHRGISAAYNAGIRAAQGEIVGFLDADDLWDSQKLSLQTRVLDETPGVDATFSWFRVIDGSGRPILMPRPRWRGRVHFRQLLADFMIRTMSTVVMRRNAALDAGLFDDRLLRCVDLEFLLRVALLRPGNIQSIPAELTSYRRHWTQRTRDWRTMRDGWNQVIASIRQVAPAETAAAEDLAASNSHRYFASLAYESGEFHEAVKLMQQSFRCLPAAFLCDGRNWKMGIAAALGVILPKPLLYTVEKAAGFDRRLPTKGKELQRVKHR